MFSTVPSTPGVCVFPAQEKHWRAVDWVLFSKIFLHAGNSCISKLGLVKVHSSDIFHLTEIFMKKFTVFSKRKTSYCDQLDLF